MLAPYACNPARSRGRQHAEAASTSGRSNFQRDRDRIIHAGAFRKLQYKTQVFINHEGDYYRTRLTHSLEVAQITRSICRILGLDEDLGEAIALAHDLGHTCFGHTGEDALNESMQDVGGYDSNDQTIRIITGLEERYAAFDGLNLTWETVEGIAKHNGPLTGPFADKRKHPHGASASIAALDAVWPLEISGFASLEAQVAALADDVAYNAHDIDDGLRSRLISYDDLVEMPLTGPILADLAREYPGIEGSRKRNELHRRLLAILISDVLAETQRRLAEARPQSVEDVRKAGSAFVLFSEALRPSERAIRNFLFERVYRSPQLSRVRIKAYSCVQHLYFAFMEEVGRMPPDWQKRISSGADKKTQARVVADYIAGMTDRFAMQEYERIFGEKMLG